MKKYRIEFTDRIDGWYINLVRVADSELLLEFTLHSNHDARSAVKVVTQMCMGYLRDEKVIEEDFEISTLNFSETHQ